MPLIVGTTGFAPLDCFAICGMPPSHARQTFYCRAGENRLATSLRSSRGHSPLSDGAGANAREALILSGCRELPRYFATLIAGCLTNIRQTLFLIVGTRGIEPPLQAPHARVLPLYYVPFYLFYNSIICYNSNRFFIFVKRYILIDGNLWNL